MKLTAILFVCIRDTTEMMVGASGDCISVDTGLQDAIIVDNTVIDFFFFFVLIGEFDAFGVWRWVFESKVSSM